MSDVTIVFLFLAGIYLLECICWLPEDAVAFRRTWDGAWTVVRTEWRIGALRLRGAAAPPFLPWNAIVVAAEAPVGAAAEGFWARSATEFFRFGHRHFVAADEKKLRCDGRVLADVTSRSQSRHLARWLGHLEKAPVEERAALIAAETTRALDCAAAQAVLEKYRSVSRFLSVISEFLFWYAFLLSPILIYRFGLLMLWPFLVAVLFVLLALTSWGFFRVHKVFYPEDLSSRWTGAITMLLSPPMAIRAPDLVERDLLSTFHPLAVAAALLKREEFEGLARQALSEVRFPLPTVDPPAPERCDAEAWLDEHWRMAVERFVTRQVGDPEALTAAPQRESDACRSYCPRCGTQYVIERAHCAACPGIALLSFGNRGSVN